MSIRDLACLPNDPQRRDAIINLLHSRFKNDQPYTHLGHHRLVVINPFKQLDLLNDAAVHHYAEQGYKDLSSNATTTTPSEPHVYELATKTYYVMRRRAEDIAIVLSGLSGSGKSTTHRHLLNELLYLSSHTRREDKLRRQIISAQTILEALSTAATAENVSASHMGHFQTLYFNERGRILGAYSAVYLLDKFRVTSPQGNANYNIFYQLLAGTSAQEKAALHINYAADHFMYLKDPQGDSHRAALYGPPSARDEIAFGEFKAALKKCGFKAKTIAQICQLLAAILHLGNVQFVGNSTQGSSSSSPSGPASGPAVVSNEACRIKNKDTLSLVAAALGVATAKLEATLTHKLKLLGKEFCTAFLTVETATMQRDALARALYSILVLWIVQQLNEKLALGVDHDKHANTISILDPVGFSHPQQQKVHSFIDLCTHFCAERILQLERESIARSDPLRKQDGLAIVAPTRPFFQPTSLGFFLHSDVVPLLNRESERLQAYALDATDANFLSMLYKQKKKQQQPNDPFRALEKSKSSDPHCFAIQHHVATVEYSAQGLLENNLDALSPDFVLLFRYSCTNAFLRELFESPVLLATETHPRDERTIIKAQLPAMPKQWMLSITSDEKEEQQKSTIVTAMDQTLQGMSRLVTHLSRMRLYQIIHVAPNDQQKPDVLNTDFVQAQLDAFGVYDYMLDNDLVPFQYTFADFLERYQYLESMLLPFTTSSTDSASLQDKVVKLVHVMQWTNSQAQVGRERIWIAYDVWHDLENHLRVLEKEARIREREERLAAIEAEKEAARIAAEEAEAAAAAAAAAAAQEESNPFNDPEDMDSDHDFYDDRTEVGHGHGSEKGGSQWGEDDDDFDAYMNGFGPNLDMSNMVEDHQVQPQEVVEEVPITRIRQWWARFVWLCTWWIPSFALKYIGNMKREDVRMAWREKVTLCLLIFLFSASIIFFIVGLGPIICPGTSELYGAGDVSVHQTINNYWISIRGKVYDMTNFVQNPHGTSTYMATKSTLEPLAGRDLSYTFPPPLTTACAGLVTDNSITVTPNDSIVLGPFVHYSGGQQSDKSLVRMQDPQWLEKYFYPVLNPNKKGDLVISQQQLKGDFEGWGRLALSIDGKVYDITDYMDTARQYPRGATGVPNYHYLDEMVETLFMKAAGTDATNEWNQLSQKMDPTAFAQNKACLDNVFYIGRLDYRDSLRCTFVNYLLLSFAVVTSLVIVVKFLAALQFGGEPMPEDQDKFVICQVPCYTEDEESLRKTIDSLTTMTYDDKRKLLFLIADGMIIGSGNDKPTPRILLDILGHDEKDDPEPAMFKSVGEGSKQLNYGKVYSGLYAHEGHTVPYIVVVKVGKSTERTKPGNRGKRDSQIICMNFLSKVHFNAEMNPLELEIYRNIKHVIGIDPALYEFIMMVDSDTEVYPDALTRLVSCMLHDSNIIGLCGETELCNEDTSWTTRIQVYEYYISHHLVKAFESLFGSVTCLPGCFCMYRIRTARKRQPLIVSPSVIREYSDNQVDTLHKKNLLHLGEDRYLTTLMMKHFPQYKLSFTPYARCRTVAPDRWRVLLSQRRRWINSTIHNLLELILLPELCGFCCLSMRFVVMIDLIGTLTLPASVIYLVYLLYIVGSNTGPVPVIALGMLAGAYGLQALIFILKRQWQHIGWMIIYLLAIPIFSFLIPLYSFWHFDDFSWGNTRVVVGDKKKQIIVTDDEKFEEKMIPLKRWDQYELELQQNETKSLASEHTRFSDDNIPLGAVYQEQAPPSPPPATAAEENHLMVPLPSLGSERRLSEFSVDLAAVLHNNRTTNEEDPNDEEAESKPILPEDDEIEHEIRRILAGANLEALTKKQVRDQLSQTFGVDLTIKKGFINATIEKIVENEY